MRRAQENQRIYLNESVFQLLATLTREYIQLILHVSLWMDRTIIWLRAKGKKNNTDPATQ